MWSAEFKTLPGASPEPLAEAPVDALVDALHAVGATGVVAGWEDDGTALSARFCVETAARDMVLAFHLAHTSFERALEKAGLARGIGGAAIEEFEEMARRHEQQRPEAFAT